MKVINNGVGRSYKISVQSLDLARQLRLDSYNKLPKYPHSTLDYCPQVPKKIEGEDLPHVITASKLLEYASEEVYPAKKECSFDGEYRWMEYGIRHNYDLDALRQDWIAAGKPALFGSSWEELYGLRQEALFDWLRMFI